MRQSSNDFLLKTGSEPCIMPHNPAIVLAYVAHFFDRNLKSLLCSCFAHKNHTTRVRNSHFFLANFHTSLVIVTSSRYHKGFKRDARKGAYISFTLKKRMKAIQFFYTTKNDLLKRLTKRNYQTLIQLS